MILVAVNTIRRVKYTLLETTPFVSLLFRSLTVTSSRS